MVAAAPAVRLRHRGDSANSVRCVPLTGDTVVTLLAGTLARATPCLHTVFVHQYTLEAVITALFPLAATGRDDGGRRAPFRRVALARGIASFLSVPAVFDTFRVVNLSALYAVRTWIQRWQPVRSILWSAAAGSDPLTQWCPPRCLLRTVACDDAAHRSQRAGDRRHRGTQPDALPASERP